VKSEGTRTTVSDQPISGMTVNERLSHLGLADAFASAARARNRPAMIEVLIKAQLKEAQAKETTDAVLAQPRRYGF
jgi:hypothetical protein